MRDCYYERDTGIGDFEVRDSGNNHLNELRTGMSVDENEKHQVKRLRSGCYCAGMKIISEAKLPIYQKSSMAHRATRHVRLLRQLKCLTASKNLQRVSELYIYDALNLLSCMTLDVKNIQFIFLHHKGKLFMVLDYPKDFGNAANAAKEGLQRKTHWAAYYFTTSNSWYLLLELAITLSTIRAISPLLPDQWHHGAYRRCGTGCKSLLQQCVSALSDRKQRWQDLELPRCTSIREKF